MSPYTNTQNYIPSRKFIQQPRGLRTATASRCAPSLRTLSVGLGCLLLWSFSGPLLSWYWRLFYYPFVCMAFSWFRVSESNIRTESTISDSFSLSSELAISSAFRPLTTSDHVLFLAFSIFLASSSPFLADFGCFRNFWFWTLPRIRLWLLQPIQNRILHPIRFRGHFRSFPAPFCGLLGLFSPSSSARQGVTTQAHPTIAATGRDQGAWWRCRRFADPSKHTRVRLHWRERTRSRTKW